MELTLEIAKLFVDGTAEDQPRIWTVVGHAWPKIETNAKDEPAESPLLNGICVQLSYCPPHDPKGGNAAPEPILGATRRVATISLETWKGIEAKPGASLWVAHFYPHRHPVIVRFFQDVTLRNKDDGPDDGRRIAVSAWCENAAGRQTAKTKTVFASNEIANRSPWDVGVLLVHGIGKYKTKKVLTDFGEPLVDFVRDWVESYNRLSAERILNKDREIWVNRCEAKIWSFPDYVDMLGVRRALAEFKRPRKHLLSTEDPAKTDESDAKTSQEIAGKSKKPKPKLTAINKTDEQTPVLLSLRVHDTQVQGQYAGTTALNVVSIDKRGLMKEANIIFKESNCSEYALVPDRAAMKAWISSAYGMIIANILRRRLARGRYHNQIGHQFVSWFFPVSFSSGPRSTWPGHSF